jgi:hypothetical protein
MTALEEIKLLLDESRVPGYRRMEWTSTDLPPRIKRKSFHEACEKIRGAYHDGRHWHISRLDWLFHRTDEEKKAHPEAWRLRV